VLWFCWVLVRDKEWKKICSCLARLVFGQQLVEIVMIVKLVSSEGCEDGFRKNHGGDFYRVNLKLVQKLYIASQLSS
jgi:hypothetical protein